MPPQTCPDIPGYYWDDQKKRYFLSVSGNHASSGSSGVQAVHAGVENQRRHLKERHRKIPTGQKASPLAAKIPSGITAAQISQLRQQGRLSLPEKRAWEVSQLSEPRQLYEGTGRVEALAASASLHLIAFQQYGAGVFSIDNDSIWARIPAPQSTSGNLSTYPGLLSLSSSHKCLAAILHDSTRSVLVLQTLPCQRGVVIDTGISDCSAMEPSKEGYYVSGIHRVAHKESSVIGELQVDVACGYHSNVICELEGRSLVSRLLVNGQSIYAGSARGSIWKIDRRDRIVKPSKMITHGSGVANMLIPDENRLIVAGLESNMALYDLRNYKFPVHRYSRYMNESNQRIGLEASPSGEIVAYGNENGAVTFADITSGTILRIMFPGAETVGRATESAGINMSVETIRWTSNMGIFYSSGNSVWHSYYSDQGIPPYMRATHTRSNRRSLAIGGPEYFDVFRLLGSRSMVKF